MTRTLVLGLDGATFDVLDPLIEDGTMPTLARLKEEAAVTDLQSTMPPVTGPAWLSLATGLSPGSTGIYDFIYRDNDEEFDFSYLSSSKFKGRSVWDHLSETGHEVGVVDYPLLSAYPINGFIVCGGLGSGGSEVYPEGLTELIGESKIPEAHMDLRDPKYEDIDVFVDEISENLHQRAAILERLLKTQEWDFCWAVFQETDWFQHMMWKCFDDSHPEADDVTDANRDAFREFWRDVDDIIARCIELTDNETNLVIQSDHGFGPMYDQSFRLNTWLQHNDYQFQKSFGTKQFWAKKYIRRALGDIARAVHLRKWAPNLFDWGRNKTASMGIELGSLDLDRTLVFDPGHIGSMGGLYVNNQALTDQTEEEVIDEVRERLHAFGDENDFPVETYTPEELYGKQAPGSPDIIVRVSGTMIEDIGWEKPVIGTRPERLSYQNGSHRQEGMLLATGPDFDPGEIDEAYVWDLAPTLLHVYNLPVPDTMDGHVLTDMLTTNREVEYTKTSPADEKRLSEGEQEQIHDQLSDLGYFE